MGITGARCTLSNVRYGDLEYVHITSDLRIGGVEAAC